MFTVTSFTHPTMLAKLRAAIAFAVKGEGDKMNGHAHHCYITNGKGRQIMRVRWFAKSKEVEVLAGCTATNGSKDVTALVKAAFIAAREALINPNMAVCK